MCLFPAHWITRSRNGASVIPSVSACLQTSATVNPVFQKRRKPSIFQYPFYTTWLIPVLQRLCIDSLQDDPLLHKATRRRLVEVSIMKCCHVFNRPLIFHLIEHSPSPSKEYLMCHIGWSGKKSCRHCYHPAFNFYRWWNRAKFGLVFRPDRLRLDEVLRWSIKSKI